MRKIARIDKLLISKYGKKCFKNGKDPLTELIFTVLSQNTSDKNRDRAFKSLLDSFSDWDEVARSKPAKLEKAIRVGGLARIKANRIIEMLDYIKSNHGHLSLNILHEWDNSQVRDYLLDIDGVGPKTAACVLAFSLGRNVMPVDTHVRRVLTRLDILPPRISDNTAHEFFYKFEDSFDLYQFHLNLIEHGRNVCRARKPLCIECNMKKMCSYYSTEVQDRRDVP